MALIEISIIRTSGITQHSVNLDVGGDANTVVVSAGVIIRRIIEIERTAEIDVVLNTDDVVWSLRLKESRYRR